MNWVLLLIFHMIPGTLADDAQTPPTNHKVQIKSSKFVIYGETNLNTFDCDLFKSSGEETLKVTSNWSDYKINFDGLVLRYKVSEFDCGHPIMNKDFSSILRSGQHPYLFLKINDIFVDKETSIMEKLDVESFVTISLAGVEKTKIIENATVINYSDCELTFAGKDVLNMTDFGIEPPTKFLGLVSVSDQLAVEFEVKLEVTPIN